jgi:hypothetical protein
MKMATVVDQGEIAMRRLMILPVVVALVATSALACGGRRVASALVVDRALAESKLSDADVLRVKALRERIVDLSARGDGAGALAAEDDAMTIMGHEFRPMRGGCGGWARKKTTAGVGKEN